MLHEINFLLRSWKPLLQEAEVQEVKARHQKLTCRKSEQFPEHSGRWFDTFVLIVWWKNTRELLLEVTIFFVFCVISKKRSSWLFFGEVRGNSGKIPSHPQKCACPCSYVGKSGFILFHRNIHHNAFQNVSDQATMFFIPMFTKVLARNYMLRIDCSCELIGKSFVEVKLC